MAVPGIRPGDPREQRAAGIYFPRNSEIDDRDTGVGTTIVEAIAQKSDQVPVMFRIGRRLRIDDQDRIMHVAIGPGSDLDRHRGIVGDAVQTKVRSTASENSGLGTRHEIVRRAHTDVTQVFHDP